MEEHDKLKKSRAWANAYELSQDLHDKQLEMLERKYGGHLRARRAARIIQHAYRQYCMNKNFAKLRVESEERRLSRRFAEVGRSKTIWSDMVNNIEKDMGLHARYYSTEEVSSSPQNQRLVFTRTEDAYNQNVAIHKEYTKSDSSSRTVRVMQKSHSLQITNRDRKLQKSLGLDLSTINENTLTRGSKLVPPPGISVTDESNNNGNSYLNDSSASDSPQDTPVEPHVDLPSVNFENLLESKETDILNDSFHSDSSQEVSTPHGMTPLMSPISGLDSSAMLNDTHNSSHHSAGGGRTYENFHSQYSESQLQTQQASAAELNTTPSSVNSTVNSSHIAPIVTPETSTTNTRTQIPIQGATAAIYTKVPLYDNSEVRLRKQWANNTETLPPPPTGSEPSISVPTQPTKKSDSSPIWKRKSSTSSDSGGLTDDAKRMSNISEASEPESDAKSLGSLDGRSMASLDERGSRDGLSSQGSDTASMGSHDGMGNTYHRSLPSSGQSHNQDTLPRTTDRQRKRAYRIGLNLFNKLVHLNIM